MTKFEDYADREQSDLTEVQIYLAEVENLATELFDIVLNSALIIME